MHYYFQGYKFKSEQLVLLKRNQIINLRANEAKLLKLLLSDPEHVFSKQEILDSVWAGKSVAEQSIFQNISNLRAIFGEGAITTHPKKGYQWNIQLEEPAISSSEFSHRFAKKNRLAIGLVLLTLFIGMFAFFSPTISPEKDKVVIGLLPVDIQKTSNLDPLLISQSLLQQFNAEEQVSILPLKSNKSVQDLIMTPELSRAKELAQTNADLLLATHSRKYQSTYFTSFILLSKNNSWQGVISAKSVDEVVSQLVRHIARISPSSHLKNHQSNVKSVTAQLRLLQQQYPEDIIILHNMITKLLETGVLSEASLLTEQLKLLAEKQNNQQYLGLAFVLESEVLIHHKRFNQAKEQLQIAASRLSSIDDLSISTRIATLRADIAFYEHNYQDTKSILLSAANELKSRGAWQQQLEQMVSMAVYANKFKRLMERDKLLLAATKILDDNNAATTLYSSIYFQQGLFAELAADNAQAEAHYRELLMLFSPEQERWEKERAQYHLSMLLCRNQRFEEAIAIFEHEGALTAKENVILGQIYQKWNNTKQAVHYAKQAYQLAVLSGEPTPALDAALLLIELSELDPKLNKAHYLNFLKKESMTNWVNFTKQRLVQAGIYQVLETPN